MARSVNERGGEREKEIILNYNMQHMHHRNLYTRESRIAGTQQPNVSHQKLNEKMHSLHRPNVYGVCHGLVWERMEQICHHIVVAATEQQEPAISRASSPNVMRIAIGFVELEIPMVQRSEDLPRAACVPSFDALLLASLHLVYEPSQRYCVASYVGIHQGHLAAS